LIFYHKYSINRHTVYLETSALLTWLFDEPDAAEIIDTLNHADLIVTSDLLRIETFRAIKRALYAFHSTFRASTYQAADSRSIVIPFKPYAQRSRELIEGTPVALLGLNLEMVGTLVKGTFQGFKKSI